MAVIMSTVNITITVTINITTTICITIKFVAHCALKHRADVCWLGWGDTTEDPAFEDCQLKGYRVHQWRGSHRQGGHLQTRWCRVKVGSFLTSALQERLLARLVGQSICQCYLGDVLLQAKNSHRTGHPLEGPAICHSRSITTELMIAIKNARSCVAQLNCFC